MLKYSIVLPSKESPWIDQVLKYRLLHYDLSSMFQLSSSVLSMTRFWSLLPELLQETFRYNSASKNGVGLLLSVVYMVIAAIVERECLETALEYGLVDLLDTTVPMTLFCLTPQYLLFGL